MADDTTPADTADTTTRDLSTLSEDGPALTSFEAPSARAAYTDRPSFSPVAQPGLSPEIWYHTVPGQGEMRAYAPPSNGMISRLNGATQTVTVQDGGGGGKRRKKRGKKAKGGPERQWLIHKTGSQHPWSWLARHHEEIIVGPKGSRWRIVKDR
jgi:hypothetical protein